MNAQPITHRIADELLADRALLNLSNRMLSYDIRQRFHVDRRTADHAIATARRPTEREIARTAIAFASPATYGLEEGRKSAAG